MPIGDAFRPDEFRKRKDLVQIVARDHRIDVYDQAQTESRLQRAKQTPALESPVEIAGHAAHEVVRLAQSIQSNVDVKLEAGILHQAMLGDLVNAMRLQSVRRQVDVVDTVVADEEIDDLGQFFAQRGLAAAEPQVCEWRRVFREPDDLLPRQVALLIQLIPVKTRLACRVAMRRDEKDDRVQLSLAAEPPDTRVSLGEISL